MKCLRIEIERLGSAGQDHQGTKGRPEGETEGWQIDRNTRQPTSLQTIPATGNRFLVGVTGLTHVCRPTLGLLSHGLKNNVKHLTQTSFHFLA
ncbi:MAG TPA: hypothetical protein EYG57_10005 [Planctomycetes bacterium]|nr:hypothetical protein [Planctomycetota bacterium]